MSFLLAVRRAKPSLVASSRYAVLVSMITAWNNCRIRGNRPEEPDFVASLIINGTKIIDHEWREVLSRFGYDISVTGVYCHQTPKVKHDMMMGHSCELGDLLWCHVHTDVNGDIVRNAILYQAKMSSDQPHKLNKRDLDQYNLYSKWPEFMYVGSGALNGKTRNVKPSAPRRGAQYLLIDDRPPENPESGMLGFPGTYPVGSCIANNPIIDHVDLGMELVHSMELLSGDAFDDRSSASKDSGWSSVVWDILESSAQKAFRRARSGYGGEPRSVGALTSEMDGCYVARSSGRGTLLSSLSDFSFKDGLDNRRDGMWNDEGGGSVSVLLVETFASREE